jgi:glycosyltransferase involved in cell wall biosynthesis
MKICAIVKYPPIQGGVSAQSFWLLRSLADAGHQVFVVTNADCVEDEYRIHMSEDDLAWLDYQSGSGGFVRTHFIEGHSARYVHVPQSKLFVSKLAAVATDTVRAFGCDVIFAYYLEPYGLAAHLASSWTGVPYVIRNAGSDHGRLMIQPDLATTYREVVRRADGICVNKGLNWLGLGAPPDAFYRAPLFYLPRAFFNPQVEPLDLNATLDELRIQGEDPRLNPRPVDPTLPTIGIYGKVGHLKGSFDLIASLAQLAQQGLRFNFVAVTRGLAMEEFRETIRTLGLEPMSWLLPFVPHWKIARFIRSCTAVCFLERDFPIRGHAPRVPSEVLACGTCMVLSREILDKQSYRRELVDGENHLLVQDPKDHQELAAVLRRVIQDPGRAAEIGRAGHRVDVGSPEQGLVAKQYEDIFADVLRRRRGEQSLRAPGERPLPADRTELIKETAGPLVRLLGEELGPVLERFFRDHPTPDPNPLCDAAAFCRVVERQSAAEDRPDRADTARFTQAIIDQTLFSEEDLRTLPFDASDRLSAASSASLELALLDLAPLRSRWIQIGRYAALPDWLSREQPGAEQIFVFHKLPNGHGHHFRINRLTADLLQRCQGVHSTRLLIEDFRRGAGLPYETVRAHLVPVLLRLHREKILIFVEPSEGGSGKAAASDQGGLQAQGN